MEFDPDEIDPELIQSLYTWGHDEIKIVPIESAWYLYMYDCLIACGEGEDPITAMDNLYQRVVERFVTNAIEA